MTWICGRPTLAAVGRALLSHASSLAACCSNPRK